MQTKKDIEFNVCFATRLYSLPHPKTDMFAESIGTVPSSHIVSVD